MTSKRALIIGALCALGLGLAFAGLEAAQPASSTHGDGASAGPARVAGFHHRWSHGRRGIGRMCSHRHDAWIENTVAVVEGFVDFTPPQAEAWNRLTGALRSGNASVREVCDGLKKAGRPKTISEKLARMETMMAAGLGVVQEVRPAFDGFYAVLTDKQRKALDGLISRGRHHE